MKACFPILCAVLSVATADHGHGHGHGHPSENSGETFESQGYGPARIVPSDPGLAYSAPPPIRTESQYSAPPPIRTETESQYSAPPPIRTESQYSAPPPIRTESQYSAPPPIRTESQYSAPPPIRTESQYSAPPPIRTESQYSAPPPIRTESQYSAPPPIRPEAQYTAPEVAPAGYASTRTEEIRTPSQNVEYSAAWNAPVYQRVAAERSEGYAANQGYGAPVGGYSAASPPSAEYGSPLAETPRGEYGAPAQNELRYVGDGTAYIRFNQQIPGSYGTRTTDAYGGTQETYEDVDSRYNFEYGVNAPNGDIKRAEETREGMNSRGSYSFLQPDGCTRTVNYMTDEWGFKAIVEYRGPDCKEKYAL
ncbi:unnamed protein product [Cyprideis torosa]|uniref:Uncharacterized protein n=1 Tax=Cyprideis torosa TaxID=163714 RepID=A0A7R8W427_9CRUS|nr:unnamed protein product [Cyprideis torosa]CAG0883690.1 unnamed protein product [Cyprideis torosa]